MKLHYDITEIISFFQMCMEYAGEKELIRKRKDDLYLEGRTSFHSKL